MKTEVVTTGKWDERVFAGIVFGGKYYSRGEARLNKDPLVRKEYWRARRTIKNRSYSLEDSPLEAYEEGRVKVWHHDLKEKDT